LRNAETGVVGVFLRSAVMNSFWSADAVAYAGAIDIENIVKEPDAAVYSASRWLAVRAVGGELSPRLSPQTCGVAWSRRYSPGYRRDPRLRSEPQPIHHVQDQDLSAAAPQSYRLRAGVDFPPRSGAQHHRRAGARSR
jgi:hypothetical protein